MPFLGTFSSTANQTGLDRSTLSESSGSLLRFRKEGMWFLILILIPLFSFSKSEEVCQDTLVDLTSPGEVLSSLRAYDQGNMGICYAASASVVLQTQKGQPAFDPLQLSIMAGISYSSGPSKKRALDKKGDGFQNGGNACDVVNLAAGEKYCPKGTLTLQHLPKEKLDEVFVKLAKLFDLYHKKKLNKDEKLNLINKSLREILNSEFLIADYCKTDPTKAIISLTKKIKTYKQSTEVEKISKVLNKLILKKSDPAFRSDTRRIHDKMPELLDYFSPIELHNESTYTADEVKACVAAEEAARLERSIGELEGDCEDDTLEYLAGMKELKSMGMSVSDILKMNSGMYKRRDQYFTDFFDCPENQKIQVDPEVTCYDEVTYGFDLGKKAFEKYKKKMGPEIRKHVDSKNPLVLGVCAGMFYNPEANCEDGIGHEVVMIGYKCEQGKIKYLIQNSWGADCELCDGSYEKNGNGGIWLPEDVVLKNTGNFGFFKRNPKP